MQIGRIDLVFILDCEESNLQQHLEVRLAETGRPDDNEKAVASNNTLYPPSNTSMTWESWSL